MNSFNVELLDINDYTTVCQFLCRIFCGAGALHRCLGIETEEYEPALRPVLERIAKEGHSFIARDANSGSIVGAILACDYLTSTSVDSELLPKIKPLSALLSTLAELHRPVQTPESGETLLVDMAATDPTHRGAGIYRTLRETVHQSARAAGFRTVYGELSAASTQHVCVNHFGHIVLAEIACRSFEYDGWYPFASVISPPTVQLVEGKL